MSAVIVTLNFFSMSAFAGPSGQPDLSKGSFVVPGVPAQGGNFLKDSLNVIPSDMDEFQIGGSIAFPPAGGFCEEITATQGAEVGPVLGCGGINAVLSLKTSLNKFRTGILGAYNAAAAGATTLITALPLLLVAYVSPTLYQVLTNSMGANVTELIGMDIPSCQDIKDDIDDYMESDADKGTWAARGAGMAAIFNKHKNVARAKVFASASGKGIEEIKGFLEGVDKKSNKELNKGLPCPDKLKEKCLTVSTRQMLRAALKELNRVQNKSACLGIAFSTSLLQQYLGLEPGTKASDEQIEEVVNWMILGLGEYTVTITPGSDGAAPTNASGFSSGGGLSVLQNSVVTAVYSLFSGLIGEIQKRNPALATPEDVMLLKIKTAWAFGASPDFLDYIAQKTKVGDTEIILLQGGLTGALADVKLTTGLRLLLQTINLVSGHSVYAEYPPLASLASLVTDAATKITSSTEEQLLAGEQEDREQVLRIVQRILQLKEARETYYQKSGRSS